MFKKIFLGIVAIAGLASCSGDFTDWLNPQQSEAEAAAEKFVMALQPTISNIDFASYTEDKVQLFSTNLQEDQTEGYDVVLSGNDNTVSFTTPDGYVETSDLVKYVNQLWGKAPQARDIKADVSTDVKVKTGSTTVVVERSADFAFKATPDAPVIYPHLYLIGAPSEWNPTCTSLPFSHSGNDVYEDPVFTISVTIGAGETWFAFADDNTVANNDWSLVFGALEGNGNNKVGEEGMLARRNVIGNDGSFKVAVEEESILKITVNMLEGTYLINVLPNVPEYYIVGRQNNWKMEKLSACYPTGKNSVSYTSYFTNAWDCRIATAANAASGTWDHDFGAVSNGCTDATGTLVENSSNCIASPGVGYYTINVDFGSMTYSWIKLDDNQTSYDKIGLVGAGDDWDNDIFLTKVYGSGDLNGADTHNWSALGVQLNASTWGVKFRANASWDKDWGGDNATTAGAFTYSNGNNGGNIPVKEAGTYNIYFNDITGQFLFVKL